MEMSMCSYLSASQSVSLRFGKTPHVPWAGWAGSSALDSHSRNFLSGIRYGKFMAEYLSSGQDRTSVQIRRCHQRNA